MASVHSQIAERGGKLVALEGDTETIATQLRLLPPSQKILVLPLLAENLPQDFDASPFNARAFVQDVHRVFTDQTRIAREFLELSTAAHPRLVLTNGGSIGARMTCVSKICEELPDGNFKRAESLLDDIVQDGVIGLMEPINTQLELSHPKSPNIPEVEEAAEIDDIEEDPTTMAMKRADALDRETAQLQAESGIAMRNVNENTRRSIYEEHLAEMPLTPTTPRTPHIETPCHADEIVKTIVTMPTRSQSTTTRNDKLEPGFLLLTPTTANSNRSLAPSIHHAELTEDEEDEEQLDQNLVLPSQQSYISVFHTPRVVYGEACMVDVQPPWRKNSPHGIRKVKSLDRFRASNYTIDNLRSVFEPDFPRPKTSDGRVETDHRRQEFPHIGRASFVRASQTTIKTKKPHTSNGSVNSISSPEARIHVYVDRGTDAEDALESDQMTTGIQSNEELTEGDFEPVFPLVEDLIIHFTNHGSNDTFESICQSYISGVYPLIPRSSPVEESAPTSTGSSFSTSGQITQPQPQFKAESDDEFDPYSSQNDYSQNKKRSSEPKKLSITDSAVHDLDASTLSITPPRQCHNSIRDKFCQFIPINQNSAIGVQNSLRALLGTHFPAGEQGYTQHYFPVLPESDRLWKPVWRNDDDGSNDGVEARTVDMIVAFGCEDGVKRDFFDSISAQLERLGTKRDGPSHVGRLDIRYV